MKRSSAPSLVRRAGASLRWCWFLNFRGEDTYRRRAAAHAARRRQPWRAAPTWCARATAWRATPSAAAPPLPAGAPIETPFGTVYASNLTPDKATGIGDWSAAHFWRALHNGRSRDGRLLYPAFPYPNYTRVTRADADAMFDYLRSLPPVEQAEHGRTGCAGPTARRRRWPSGARCTSARPSTRTTRAQSAEWNRGAYLVRGLGHCGACHTARNALGASSDMMDLSGGLIPMQNWYAPSLASPAEAGVADWELADIERLLRNRRRRAGTVLGPDGRGGAAQHAAPGRRATCARWPCSSRPCRRRPAPTRADAPRRCQSASGRARRQAVRAALRAMPWRAGRRRAGRLSAAGGQPRGHHARDRQPGAGGAERRLSAGHGRQPAALRHAAFRDRAAATPTWPPCSATSARPGATAPRR